MVLGIVSATDITAQPLRLHHDEATMTTYCKELLLHIPRPAYIHRQARELSSALLALPQAWRAIVSRAARWDKLKVNIQEVEGTIAPHFMPGVQGSSQCSAYEPARLERPMWQLQAVMMPWMHCAIRQQHRRQQAATDTLRAGILLHEYRDQSTYCFNQLHRQRQQGAVISHLQQQQGSPVADLCTINGRQQADSIIVNFVSADRPTGEFRQLPADLSAQQSLLSSLDRQLPSKTQRACEGAQQGITLDERQATLKLTARGKKPGSDGLPYEFFSQFWEVLGPELLAVLQNAF